MGAKALLPLVLVLAVGCGAPPPYTSGGPIGPSVQSRRPNTPPPGQANDPLEQSEPGVILVKPAPGQSVDDLKREFGADNVKPYKPEGIDENLRAELGLDDWFVIIVPEGDEIGIMSGLIEKGEIVDVRPAPRGTGRT